jgi:hypothetical protein
MPAQPEKALKRDVGRRLRRFPRYRSQFPVTVKLLFGEKHQHLDAHCKDLSEAGLGALLAAELTLGEVVSLSFALPGQPNWEVPAVLRHRRGYHYGFEFLSVTPEQGKILAGFFPGLERADTD